MKRERLGSRLGFILLSAGCAIGIGNVWKFPYMVGQNGGGLFVLIYLFFLIILGVPVMTMEFSLGRASQKSPARMYQALEPEGSKWHWHGLVAVIGNYILMMFYTTVCGWMLRYFVDTAKGDFVGLDAGGVEQHFGTMLGDAGMQVLYMTIAVVIGFAVCAIGLQNGLEKITKWMMIALIVIMIVLAVNSAFMDGGEDRSCKCHCSGDESGVLHPQPWHGCNGDLRQLYRQGPCTDGRGGECGTAGYLCCTVIRSDYFSGMLRL